MNKISVIIPTLWKTSGLKERLLNISNVESVGEIILIDNSETPEDIQNIDKLKHIKEYENTYVNPAWNKGARLAKYDKLCFVNDDVDFDLNIFETILPLITEDKGMIGLAEFHGAGVWEDEPGADYSRPSDKRGDRGYKTHILEINERKPGYGCFFFMHKKSYVQIPEDIKIWYGDDWLFYKSGKQNYSIMNFDIVGKPSQTSDLVEFNPVKNLDKLLYYRLFQ